MECLQNLHTFLHSIINDINQIFLPTNLAVAALYFPIFLLSILNHSISKVSKWIVTIPIVIYLLSIPIYQPIRTLPIVGPCITNIAIYFAQKVCEWFLFRRNEFHQWSFFDIQHELFFYRVYTQCISIRNFNKNRKEIFFTGSIQYDKHLKSLIYISCNIIKYFLLFDLTIYLTSEAFRTEFYEKYYKNYLLIRIIINQSCGYIVYLIFMIIYELFRYVFCLIFNRPLALMPDPFHQPYRAISPGDFWSRWHQLFKNTWIELIFKPISRFIHYHWPCLSKQFIYSISSMCVFLFSGIVHEYTIYVIFGKYFGDQIKFFLLQGLAVVIEYALKHYFHDLYIPKSIGFLLTFIFNGITAGYFIHPWISYFATKRRLNYSIIDFIMRNLFNKY